MILNLALVCVDDISLLFCKNDKIIYDYALCDTCIRLDESSMWVVIVPAVLHFTGTLVTERSIDGL